MGKALPIVEFILQDMASADYHKITTSVIAEDAVKELNCSEKR
jgi:hypothetical protein